MNKKVLLILIFSFCIAIMAAQGFLPLSFGASASDYGKDIRYDVEGNFYVTGYFQGSVDFDPSPGINIITANGSLTNPGAIDTFVAKYNAIGELIWVFSISSPGADMPHSLFIGENSFVLTGYIGGNADFDPNPLYEEIIYSNTGRDMFIAKYSLDGEFMFAMSAGDAEEAPLTVDDDRYEDGMDVCLDSDGNIYATGVFKGIIDLDPTQGVAEYTSLAESRDLWVVSLDSDGNYRWGFSIGSSGQDHGHGIRVVNNQVILAGFFSDVMDSDPSQDIYNLTSNGGWDIFLSAYDVENGGFLWAEGLGLNGNDQVRPGGICVDSEDKIYITGDFQSTVDFDSSENNAFLTSNGSSDIFVAVYNYQGEYQRAFSLGSSQFDFAHRITTDSNNNILITGQFTAPLDFDISTNEFILSPNGSAGDIFLAKYTLDSELVWAKSFGGDTNDATSFQIGTGVSVNTEDEVIITGRYYSNAVLDSFPQEISISSNGSCDCFVVKYDVNGFLVHNQAVENIEEIYQNPFNIEIFPNPFKQITNLSYSMPQDTNAEIAIYNILGQKVKTLSSGPMKKGDYVINWNAYDNKNEKVANGVYFLRIETPLLSTVNKFLLIK